MSSRDFIRRNIHNMNGVPHNVVVYKYVKGEYGSLHRRLWGVFRYPNMDVDMSFFEKYFKSDDYIIQVELLNSDGVMK